MMISTSVVVTFHHLFTILCQKFKIFPIFEGAYWRIYGRQVVYASHNSASVNPVVPWLKFVGT